MQWYYFFAHSLPWHAIFPIYIYFLFFSFLFFFLFVLCSHSTASTSFSFCVHISSSPFFHFFSILCEQKRECVESKRTRVNERMRQSEYVVLVLYEREPNRCMFIYVHVGICLYVLFVFELISYMYCVCSVCNAMHCTKEGGHTLQEWRRGAGMKANGIKTNDTYSNQKGWSEKKKKKREKKCTKNERRKKIIVIINTYGFSDDFLFFVIFFNRRKSLSLVPRARTRVSSRFSALAFTPFPRMLLLSAGLAFFIHSQKQF